MTTKNNTKTLFRFITITLVVGLGIFIYSRFNILTSGAQVVLNNVSDGMSIDGRVLHLEGNAKKASKITINNREITIDTEGDFKETLVFSPGLNTINIFAEDRYKSITEKIIHIYVPEPPIVLEETEILPSPDIPLAEEEDQETEDIVLTVEENLETSNS